MNTVYEIWWPDRDICLYVGVTGNLRQRLAEHRRNHGSWWLNGAVEVRTTEVADRREAEALEMRRIYELRPANNVRGNPDHCRWLREPYVPHYSTTGVAS